MKIKLSFPISILPCNEKQTYTLINPYLTLTPQPQNCIPLHNCGKRIPVLGSFKGPIITTSHDVVESGNNDLYAVDGEED